MESVVQPLLETGVQCCYREAVGRRREEEENKKIEVEKKEEERRRRRRLRRERRRRRAADRYLWTLRTTADYCSSSSSSSLSSSSTNKTNKYCHIISIYEFSQSSHLIIKDIFLNVNRLSGEMVKYDN